MKTYDLRCTKCNKVLAKVDEGDKDVHWKMSGNEVEGITEGIRIQCHRNMNGKRCKKTNWLVCEVTESIESDLIKEIKEMAN